LDGTCQFGRILPKPDEISEHLEPCRGANLLLRLTPHFARWYFPESPFSAPVPWNSIAPEADCEAKRTFAPKKPAIAEEKPDHSLPSLPRPPHREPSKLIAPTPIHPPLPSVIRIRGIPVGRLVCRKRQQRDPAQHRPEPYSRQVSFRQHQPAIPRMLYQSSARLHQPLLQAGLRPV